jgi:hypothetical protein
MSATGSLTSLLGWIGQLQSYKSILTVNALTLANGAASSSTSGNSGASRRPPRTAGPAATRRRSRSCHTMPASRRASPRSSPRRSRRASASCRGRVRSCSAAVSRPRLWRRCVGEKCVAECAIWICKGHRTVVRLHHGWSHLRIEFAPNRPILTGGQPELEVGHGRPRKARAFLESEEGSDCSINGATPDAVRGLLEWRFNQAASPTYCSGLHRRLVCNSVAHRVRKTGHDRRPHRLPQQTRTGLPQECYADRCRRSPADRRRHSEISLLLRSTTHRRSAAVSDVGWLQSEVTLRLPRVRPFRQARNRIRTRDRDAPLRNRRRSPNRVHRSLHIRTGDPNAFTTVRRPPLPRHTK